MNDTADEPVRAWLSTARLLTWALCLAPLGLAPLGLATLVSVTMTFGCSGAAPTYPYDKEPNPKTSEYVIGAADDLSVEVFKHQEFNAGVTVRPDGKITIPLVGDITAAGRTPSAVRAELLQHLAKYVKGELVVTVSVTAVRSYFVTVAGQVETPGRFTSQGYLTVADAIALAGGPNRFADPANCFVLRSGPDGKTRKIPVNYQQINRGEHLEQNLPLFRGDQVIVP